MSFIKITEQNSLYNDLERKSVRDLLEDINTEDQKVALAVDKNQLAGFSWGFFSIVEKSNQRES